MGNLIKQIESLEINPRYNIKQGDVKQIIDDSNNLADLIINTFKFGYLQGKKEVWAMLMDEETHEHHHSVIWNTLENIHIISNFLKSKGNITNLDNAKITDSEYKKIIILLKILECDSTEYISDIYEHIIRMDCRN